MILEVPNFDVILPENVKKILLNPNFEIKFVFKTLDSNIGVLIALQLT
jgi:hypothetical protein